MPDVTGMPGPQGGVVTKGGLFFVSAEDMALHAIDKSTGKDVWHGPLGAKSYGNPMTYRTKSGKQFVVIAVGIGNGTSLVAFSN
jgi:quinoprotein glucose dehydrogenase